MGQRGQTLYRVKRYLTGIMAMMVVKRKQSMLHFPKNEHFQTPNTTHVRLRITGGKKSSFSWKSWRALFSCNHRFEIRRSVLLLTICLRITDLKPFLRIFTYNICFFVSFRGFFVFFFRFGLTEIWQARFVFSY